MKERPTLFLAAVLVPLVLIEWLLVPHEHPVFPWHHVPGYAALIGILGSIAVVVFSDALGKLLRRRAPDVDPEDAVGPEPRHD